MTKSSESLSQYVDRILQQKELSLADVERNSDGKITSSYISRIISGKVKNLTVQKIKALALGLDVDPHEIFTVSLGKPPHNAEDKQTIDPAVFVAAAQRLLINPELLELVQVLGRMSKKEREALLVTLKYVESPNRKSRKKKKP
jgi:transcriptional regulator with XRE-family HTH domain